MAILKQTENKTVKYLKKELTLTSEQWSMIDSYAKYAALKGNLTAKRQFVIEGALEHLFTTDKEFQEYLHKDSEPKKEEPKAEVKPAAPQPNNNNNKK